MIMSGAALVVIASATRGIHKRRNMKHILRWILICILLVTFACSTYNLGSYWLDRKKSERLTEDIIEQAVQVIDLAEPQTETNQPSAPVETAPEETVPEEVILNEFAPITVDFGALEEEYKDIVAWIYCADSKINYPVVQAEDNSYYLDRLPNGLGSIGGSIFLDYRNKEDFSDFNSVLHGHNMRDGSMFGSLRNYRVQKHFDEHPIMYLLTPEQNYKLEVVAAYVASVNSYVYSFSNDELSKQEFLDEMAKATSRSDVPLSLNDRYLTLSTCAYDNKNARYVLIGKLWKIQSDAAE